MDNLTADALSIAMEASNIRDNHRCILHRFFPTSHGIVTALISWWFVALQAAGHHQLSTHTSLVNIAWGNGSSRVRFQAFSTNVDLLTVYHLDTNFNEMFI